MYVQVAKSLLFGCTYDFLFTIIQTWNTFNCIPPVGHLGPSDELMRSQADTMVSSGMAKAGYEYVNIDDW